jgi:hypothetical protein
MENSVRHLFSCCPTFLSSWRKLREKKKSVGGEHRPAAEEDELVEVEEKKKKLLSRTHAHTHTRAHTACPHAPAISLSQSHYPHLPFSRWARDKPLAARRATNNNNTRNTHHTSHPLHTPSAMQPPAVVPCTAWRHLSAHRSLTFAHQRCAILER